MTIRQTHPVLLRLPSLSSFRQRRASSRRDAPEHFGYTARGARSPILRNLLRNQPLSRTTMVEAVSGAS